MTQLRNRFLVLSVLTLCISACKTGQKASQATVSIDQKLVGEANHDWLKYKVYLLPQEISKDSKAGEQNMMFSIRIINMKDNFSPLRKLSRSLDEYNTLYEYLLNRNKDEIYLAAKNGPSYPIAYSFENNYNAFPFETVNVGYKYTRKDVAKNDKNKLELVFIDEVFARDTIKVNLSFTNKI